jgi:hypothetical protein
VFDLYHPYATIVLGYMGVVFLVLMLLAAALLITDRKVRTDWIITIGGFAAVLLYTTVSFDLSSWESFQADLYVVAYSTVLDVVIRGALAVGAISGLAITWRSSALSASACAFVLFVTFALATNTLALYGFRAEWSESVSADFAFFTGWFRASAALFFFVTLAIAAYQLVPGGKKKNVLELSAN